MVISRGKPKELNRNLLSGPDYFVGVGARSEEAKKGKSCARTTRS